jgi:hypothetical protein
MTKWCALGLAYVLAGLGCTRYAKRLARYAAE